MVIFILTYHMKITAFNEIKTSTKRIHINVIYYRCKSNEERKGSNNEENFIGRR